MQLLVCGRTEANNLLGTLPVVVGAVVSLVFPSSSRALVFDSNLAESCWSFESYAGPKLKLELDEAAGVAAAHVCKEHLERFLAFAAELPTVSDASLVIQCIDGLSMASAFGYVLLCERWGRGSEPDAFAATMRARPGALPCELIIETADALLHRYGAMVAPLRRWNEQRRCA